MTLNRHHELRFDVVGVALTAIMVTGSIVIKMLFADKIHHSDIHKMIILLCTK